MILHVSAQRFYWRNRVGRSRAHWGNKNAREKYKGSDGTANFGLLRDPSFLGPSMRDSMYMFVFVAIFNVHQIDSKNKAIGDSAHTRCQKGGVPEEAEIGRTITPF